MRVVYAIGFAALVTTITVAGLILAALSVITDDDLDGAE